MNFVPVLLLGITVFALVVGHNVQQEAIEKLVDKVAKTETVAEQAWSLSDAARTTFLEMQPSPKPQNKVSKDGLPELCFDASDKWTHCFEGTSANYKLLKAAGFSTDIRHTCIANPRLMCLGVDASASPTTGSPLYAN